MSAQVVKSPDLIILAAHNQCAFITNVKCKIAAPFRNVGNMAGNLPVIAKDRLLFQLKERITVVGPSRKAAPVPVLFSWIPGVS